jgi:hypothetical protein
MVRRANHPPSLHTKYSLMYTTRIGRRDQDDSATARPVYQTLQHLGRIFDVLDDIEARDNIVLSVNVVYICILELDIETSLSELDLWSRDVYTAAHESVLVLGEINEISVARTNIEQRIDSV